LGFTSTSDRSMIRALAPTWLRAWPALLLAATFPLVALAQAGKDAQDPSPREGAPQDKGRKADPKQDRDGAKVDEAKEADDEDQAIVPDRYLDPRAKAARKNTFPTLFQGKTPTPALIKQVTNMANNQAAFDRTAVVNLVQGYANQLTNKV